MTRIIVDTHAYGDPRIREASERVRDLIRSAAVRRYRRVIREAVVAGQPGWLGPVAWSFPTWRVRRRPFDWMVDEADVPIEPPVAVVLPERRQLRLYLRPAPPVVQAP